MKANKKERKKGLEELFLRITQKSQEKLRKTKKTRKQIVRRKKPEKNHLPLRTFMPRTSPKGSRGGRLDRHTHRITE